jgi:hypothetical protein
VCSLYDSTLRYLHDALDQFNEKKNIFIELGIRDNFNFPKLHSLTHYIQSIKLLGTADNFNTEYSKRLHIDFAKNACHSTNHKNEYLQMTIWLERREKVFRHADFLRWLSANKDEGHIYSPLVKRHRHINVVLNPNQKCISFTKLANTQGALDFEVALTTYVIQFHGPKKHSAQQLQELLYVTKLPFRTSQFTTGLNSGILTLRDEKKFQKR